MRSGIARARLALPPVALSRLATTAAATATPWNARPWLVARAFAPSRLVATAAVLAFLLAGLPFGPCPAHGHAQPYSFLDLTLERGRLSGRFTAHAFDLAHEIGLGVPDTLLDPATAARHAETLRAILAPRIVLIADGDTLRLRWTGGEVVRDKGGLAFRFEAAWPHLPGALEIRARAFPYDPQHETYLNVYESTSLRRQDLLDASKTSVTHYTGSRQGAVAVVRTFTAAGIHHIFIGPDHILFIVGLLLLGGGAIRLLKIVTAFTAAHSLTLALATLGIVNPPARLIEPAIALSIVYVGLDNLRVRGGQRDHRALIAFGFGFVHGFGFASVLRDFGLPREALGWSLFAFNLGVELGQACIVGAVAPLLAWTGRRSARAERAIVAAGSWAVAVAGGYWFVERTFLAGR